MNVEISMKKWEWGRLAWGARIGAITEAAREELEQLKKQHPDVDFEKLGRQVEQGKIKPR